jgi:hypothetical protein
MNFQRSGIAIGTNGFGDYLVLLPDENQPDKLGETIFVWFHETGELTQISNSIDQLIDNRVGCPASLADGENLSHHCTYGSRIQRFIKMWGNFLVKFKHGFVASFLKRSSVIVVPRMGLWATAHPPFLVLLHA